MSPIEIQSGSAFIRKMEEADFEEVMLNEQLGQPGRNAARRLSVMRALTRPSATQTKQ